MRVMIVIFILAVYLGGCGKISSDEKDSLSPPNSQETGTPADSHGEEESGGSSRPGMTSPENDAGVGSDRNDNNSADRKEDSSESEEETPYIGSPAGKPLYDLCIKKERSKDEDLTLKIFFKYLKENKCLELSNKFISYKTYILDFNFLDYYERKNLNEASFDLSVFKELKPLESLVLSNLKLKNTESLQNNFNISFLTLNHNSLSKVDFLEKLEKLMSLSIDHNKIADLTPLSNLKYLTNLSANNNAITDISPLANISILTSLSVSKNQINDLTPLKGLFNLHELDVSENDITICPTEAASVVLMKTCRN